MRVGLVRVAILLDPPVNGDLALGSWGVMLVAVCRPCQPVQRFDRNHSDSRIVRIELLDNARDGGLIPLMGGSLDGIELGGRVRRIKSAFNGRW